MKNSVIHEKLKNYITSDTIPWQPVIIYGLFGLLWIAIPDDLLEEAVKDMHIFSGYQELKSWLFILLTSFLLYMFTKKYHLHIKILNEKIVKQNKELEMFGQEGEGLKNRRSIEADINKILVKNKPFGVYFLDVDHFKEVNDIYGYAFGDRFLKYYRKTLLKTFPKLHIYPWGGDEFIVIDREANQKVRSQTVNGILELTNRTWLVDGVKVHSCTSIGVVQCPKDGGDAHAIFKNMELALYRAKEKGPSQYEIYHPSFRDSIERKVTIERIITSALENEEFELFYQPIYNFRTRKIKHIEALLRHKRAEMFNTCTSEIIEVAEKTGQIHQIDNWVLKKVFSEIHSKTATVPDMEMSVNLSSQTFMSDQFLENLEKLAKNYSVKASNITFELTEHTIISDINESIRRMNYMKEIGFKIALDDFGTKYSSLNYLGKLPFDVLKIDKTYVEHMDRNEKHKIIIEQVINMATAIGLETIAEGVETEEQNDALISACCTYGQGFYYSKPLSFDELQRFIAS